jgi:gentisate 1,2-dioxygenase
MLALTQLTCSKIKGGGKVKEISMTPTTEPGSHPARRQLYADMSSANLTPLWEVLHNLVPKQPQSPCVPALWKYADVRPFLMRAGEVISAQEAVRRVLILENPALRGQSCITQSLYAGLQLILPGEVAPSHRHTQSALRFIVEGSGAFTAVDGERTTMEPGDFIITPSMTYHDHGYEVSRDPSSNSHGYEVSRDPSSNSHGHEVSRDPSSSSHGHEGSGPMVWLDGLDIPLIRFLDAGFAENDTRASQAITRSEGTSYASHGHNMAPVRSTASPNKTSPIFSYPYARTREALSTLERQAPIDAWDGVKLRYVNPQTGGYPMPTMATFMQRLPAGFAGKPYRQTDGTVFSVVEGSGSAIITSGEQSTRYDFGERDHFVVPSWHSLQLRSSMGCVLFSYSDRPVQDALGIHREERLL